MREREAFVIRTETEHHDDGARVLLTVDLPDGVHIEPHEPAEPHLIPTVLEVDDADEVTVDYPEPVVKDLGWHDATLAVLEGTVRFTISGRVPADADRMSGTLRYSRASVARVCDRGPSPGVPRCAAPAHTPCSMPSPRDLARRRRASERRTVVSPAVRTRLLPPA